MNVKRFAVLLCAEDSDFVKKKYGGYSGVFVGMLGEEGEIWDFYRVIGGDFPLEDELECYDGFVVSGSCSDAHGNDIWILKLVNLLKKLDSMKKRILGICFGHQILCRALGGKTGRAVSGWDVGVRKINLSPSKQLAALKLPCSLPIYEFHRDEEFEADIGKARAEELVPDMEAWKRFCKSFLKGPLIPHHWYSDQVVLLDTEIKNKERWVLGAKLDEICI
ncbi:gamma-glutamyl peptidase 5-like isoform X2 [Telopea speciosissima]|uniref:gamma-glutamyl peptidase 5-like isoform X2 n=1 Tax=Telopea speciosissima TaxID=54955 RepID=UPI001CC462FD|nr:gamma-glutamyl peptidase 5-like isoform X2 [Telopea speciosissima]